VMWAILFLSLVLQTQAAQPALPGEAIALLKSGIEAESHHDLDAAISAFQKASELAPDSALPFAKLGEAYMSRQDYAGAIPPLRRAVELTPDSLPAQQLLGFALLTEGYAAEAIPHLELAHEQGALGIAQLQSGQATDAVVNLQSALARNPNDPDLLYYLSQAGSALASQSRDKLLSEFRNTARGHQALGQSYYETKMYPQSVQEYSRALALRSDLPGLRLELGQIYAATSDWERAEEQFRAEEKLQPGNAEAAYRLGDALLQQGKMKEAAAALQRSDQLRPNMPETLYSLGKAAAASDTITAERALKRVIELEKESPLAAQAYFTLAAIHRKQGKLDQAAQETEEFRKLQALNGATLGTKE